MIGLITGQVQYLMAPTACVMTTSGVGYDIELPLTSFCQLRLNEQASIWTHFHVREDAQLLYGFIDRKERDVFRQLIKINGVGAKMALAMLSAMSAAELKMHVEQDSETALMRIPGIGKKTAERMLLELKDKVGSFISDSDDGISFIHQSSGDGDLPILEVLRSLGYQNQEILPVLKKLDLSGLSESDAVKIALKELSKRG